MTATDLHQRMLHQLDRVKALNTSRAAAPAESVEQQSHAVQHADTSEAQPHIPAINEEMPDAERQEVFTDEDDDRSEPRPEVNQHGLVVFAGQERGLECEVMDLTTAGARLRLADDVTVPSCFELTIQPENTAQTAQVCWRNERDLGIQFVNKD
ncbi:MAG: PilZ domain-containing protein [Pseudomonadota bacterium]